MVTIGRHSEKLTVMTVLTTLFVLTALEGVAARQGAAQTDFQKIIDAVSKVSFSFSQAKDTMIDHEENETERNEFDTGARHLEVETMEMYPHEDSSKPISSHQVPDLIHYEIMNFTAHSQVAQAPVMIPENRPSCHLMGEFCNTTIVQCCSGLQCQNDSSLCAIIFSPAPSIMLP